MTADNLKAAGFKEGTVDEFLADSFEVQSGMPAQSYRKNDYGVPDNCDDPDERERIAYASGIAEGRALESYDRDNMWLSLDALAAEVRESVGEASTIALLQRDREQQAIGIERVAVSISDCRDICEHAQHMTEDECRVSVIVCESLECDAIALAKRVRAGE